ncbi:MAG: D-tyrosyl-tRNA(Tyr) deacylase [Blautia sp.]|nr:D-tyrosyl-tRNA(Tyr) deacylase [Blautia sp.]
MRFVIQVVSRADVRINGEIKGEIGKGLLVLVGIGREDDRETADMMIRKLTGLRIFEDAEGKTNLSLADVNGELLMISQFTLYADCRRGNRPGFFYAGEPEMANELYEYILEKCSEQVPVVESGVFGADMKVTLTNDGPFTIILDSEELKKKR